MLVHFFYVEVRWNLNYDWKEQCNYDIILFIAVWKLFICWDKMILISSVEISIQILEEPNLYAQFTVIDITNTAEPLTAYFTITLHNDHSVVHRMFPTTTEDKHEHEFAV